MSDYYNQHKDDRKNVASLVFFRDDVSLAEAERVIAELTRKGIVTHSTTREYQDAFGGPVWYIP
jgi:hypothetical protein